LNGDDAKGQRKWTQQNAGVNTGNGHLVNRTFDHPDISSSFRRKVTLDCWVSAKYLNTQLIAA